MLGWLEKDILVEADQQVVQPDPFSPYQHEVVILGSCLTFQALADET